MNWDDYFFSVADMVRAKSKDESAKVGVIVAGPAHQLLSAGFNGFPRRVDETMTSYRWMRPEKYMFVEHAERNAIYNACRHGIALDGAHLYIAGASFICAECARGVIQVGITQVRIRGPETPDRWRVSAEAAQEMLFEAGVDTRIELEY